MQEKLFENQLKKRKKEQKEEHKPLSGVVSKKGESRKGASIGKGVHFLRGGGGESSSDEKKKERGRVAENSKRGLPSLGTEKYKGKSGR